MKAYIITIVSAHYELDWSKIWAVKSGPTDIKAKQRAEDEVQQINEDRFLLLNKPEPNLGKDDIEWTVEEHNVWFAWSRRLDTLGTACMLEEIEIS